MTDEQQFTELDWQQVKAIFSKLVELPIEKIGSQLEILCKDKPHLMSVISEMVDIHISSQNKTITPKKPAAQILLLQAQLKTGDMVDKYKVIKVLGSGGMGHVYLAERNDEVNQQVAIKVLSKQLMDEQSLIRFDLERRILASLEHPNIARLIDAGTATDKVYYVMEYIEGIAIDEYCQKNQLDLKARLELFQKICLAVSYAHNNLIVHRDLKPGNILVTDQGEVKLLDFGIAKPLKTLPGTNSIHETMIGTTALTPQYAAPEQINGDAITVACDIYVIGLLLYKMLTEQHAFDLAGKTWGEIEQSINDHFPTLPSKKVIKTSLGFNSFTAGQWSKNLKGDIDGIISHALKKEPQERYLSVRELSADIDRFLKHEPLKIKQNQTVYRLKKLLRKHWFPVTAIITVFSVLFISSLFIWQQSKTIKSERDIALTEQKVAEDVTNFLVDTFKSADPTQVMGTKLTAGDILEQGVKQLEEQNPSPAIKNRLLSTLAEVYMNLSAYEKAEQLINQVDVHAFESKQEFIKFAYTNAKINADQGNIKVAIKIIEAVVPLLNEDDDYYFKVMNFKTEMLSAVDQFEETKALAKLLLEKAKFRYGEESFEYAIQLRVFAKKIKNNDNRNHVIDLYKTSIEIMNSLDDLPDKMELLVTMSRLIAELKNNQQYDEALIQSLKLEDEYLDIFPDNHVVFASLFNTRGLIYANSYQPEKALEQHQKSYQIYQMTAGVNSTKMAFAEINIAVVYLYLLADYEQAKNYFESALAKFIKNSGKTNNYYYMRLPYATCLIKLNQYSIAKEIIAESIKYYEERSTKAVRNLSLGKVLMAHVLIHEGDYKNGENMLKNAMPSVIKNYGNTIHSEMIESDLKILATHFGDKDEN